MCHDAIILQITLIDYGNGPIEAPQLPIVVKDKNTYTDVIVCSEQGIVFTTTKDDPATGALAIYAAATRSDGGDVSKPELVHTITVGHGPDMIKPNKDCSILAVANEGEGVYEDYLINPEGSVSLVSGPFLDPSSPPAVSHVTFPWTDDELLAKGVHLPLSKNALEYWDEHSGMDLNFTAARATYTAASVLEPEWIVWSADEKYVLVNLQENAALVKINVEDKKAEDIYRYGRIEMFLLYILYSILTRLPTVSLFFSYGLKSWETTPIDIVEDDGCDTMPTVEGLYSVRTLDAITAIIVGEHTYIATGASFLLLYRLESSAGSRHTS